MPDSIHHAPRALNRYDAFKLVALAAMTCDHWGGYLHPDWIMLRWIGRAAMPIFFFLVGYSRSYRFDGWLVAAAVAVTLLQYGLTERRGLDILWSILLARLCLRWVPLNALNRHCLALCFLCLAAWPVSYLLVSYGTGIILWACAGALARARPKNWQAQCYLAAATLTSVAQVIVMFYPMILNGLVGAMVVLATAYALTGMSLAPWPVARPLQGMLRGLSRHALLYYVVHVGLFMAAARFLYAAA